MTAPTSYIVIDEATTRSDLESEAVDSPVLQRRSVSWTSRARTATVAILFVGAVCGTYYGLSNSNQGSSKWVEYVPHSHPAFVNLDAIPVDVAVTNPGLCAPDFVQAVCTQFFYEGSDLWAANDQHPRYMHAIEMAKGLSVSRQSVLDLLTKLGMQDQNQADTTSFAFTCQELCERIVGSYPAKSIPSKSDVGCYQLHGETICDVDVDATKLAALDLKGMPKEKKESGFGESSRMQKVTKATGEGAAGGGEEIRQALKIGTAKTPEEQILMANLEQVPMGFDDLRLVIANAFHIFPTTPSDADSTKVGLPCLSGLFCKMAAQLRKRQAARRLAEDWRAVAQQTAVKAKAAVSLTLQKMEARTVQRYVEKWFGNNLDAPTRANIKRVLVGIQEMLNNVEFQYPGAQCSANMYAYVFGSAGVPYEKNTKGQFIINLCDMYMQATPDYQIEVLVHEGSHHNSMNTDDCKWKSLTTGVESTMYGQTICLEVAGQCAAGDASACSKALTNADTMEYFVADAIKKVQPPIPAPTVAAGGSSGR